MKKIATMQRHTHIIVLPNARSMSALCLGLMIILNLLSYVLDFIAVVTTTHMVHPIGDGGMVSPHEDASLGVGVTAESDQCPHDQLPRSCYLTASVSSHNIIHWDTSEVADQYHVLIALGKHLGCYLKSRSHKLSVENVLHLWQCIAIIKHWHDVIFVKSCC